MGKITGNHFSFKCPMSWDDMVPSDNGRFCSKCSKEIFDLKGCFVDDVRELQRQHGKICGMVRTAAVAASLSLAACDDAQEERPIVVVGMIEAPEGYPTRQGDGEQDQEPDSEPDSGETP